MRKEEVPATSLQSAHHPDAGYGLKGKGHEVQMAETCTEGNPYQEVKAVGVQPTHVPDQKATVPLVERLSGAVSGR